MGEHIINKMIVLKRSKTLTLFLVFLLAFGLIPLEVSASLSSISNIMTRQKISTLSSHTIGFTLSGTNSFAAGETITIDFNEDGGSFAVSGAASTIADFDFNDGTERTIVAVNTGAPSCSAGVNNVAIGINDTTGVVTIQACSTYTASSNGVTISIKYGSSASVGGAGTDRVTNPSTKGTYIVAIGGTIGDSGSFAISIPETTGDDQIPVTASVDPSITFTVVNTALALGAISTSSGTFSGTNNISVGTNAFGGYTITVKNIGSGSNPGLYASAISQLIASNTADLASNPGYGGQCNKTAGSGSCHANYPNTSTTSVGAFSLSSQTFASHGSKPAGTDTFQIRVGARVSLSQDAGSYVDTLTLLATGNF